MLTATLTQILEDGLHPAFRERPREQMVEFCVLALLPERHLHRSYQATDLAFLEQQVCCSFSVGDQCSILCHDRTWKQLRGNGFESSVMYMESSSA